MQSIGEIDITVNLVTDIFRTSNIFDVCALFLLFTAYYVIFLSFDNPLTPDNVDDNVENPMPSPIESIMAMFLMSVNSFAEYYEAFDKTSHILVAKVRGEVPTLFKCFFRVFTTSEFLSVLFHRLHGNCGDFIGQHVNRYDGKHLSKNCRNKERMAETGHYFSGKITCIHSSLNI